MEMLADTRAHAFGGRLRPPVTIAEAHLTELPLSWEWAPVDSLASAVVDGVHKTPTYVSEGIPFVTVRNLTAGKELSFEGCKYISQDDHDAFSARTKPQRGDILISKDGTIGVTRAVRTDREFSIFVSVALVKPLISEMTDYLELAFQAPQVQRQMTGVGSGLTHLVLRELKADGIPIPPLEEQREIVRRVHRLFAMADRVTSQLNVVGKRIETSGQAVLTKAFAGELVATTRADR
jgi:type I restriction enzyme, S subunit